MQGPFLNGHINSEWGSAMGETSRLGILEDTCICRWRKDRKEPGSLKKVANRGQGIGKRGGKREGNHRRSKSEKSDQYRRVKRWGGGKKMGSFPCRKKQVSGKGKASSEARLEPAKGNDIMGATLECPGRIERIGNETRGREPERKGCEFDRHRGRCGRDGMQFQILQKSEGMSGRGGGG